MPTARPSISATVGTVESMSMKPVTAVIPMIPTTTPGTFAAPATASATAFARSPAISGSPLGAANTIRPDAPLASGSRSSSRSTASCDSVPGIVAESVVDPLSVDAAANMPTSTTSQAARTALRRRKAMRPSLWSAVAIGGPSRGGAGCSLTIGAAARRDDRRRSPSAWPVCTHPVPPLGGRAEGYDGLVPRRADVLWTALAIALALTVQQLDASGVTRDDRAPDVLGALLAIAACAPVAVRRAHPLAAAVAALPFACAALALGYMVIVPVLVGLALCGRAAIHSAQRVTVPLGAYAGTLMAAAVTITG